jgi:hypothetical protein
LNLKAEEEKDLGSVSQTSSHYLSAEVLDVPTLPPQTLLGHIYCLVQMDPVLHGIFS